MSSAEALARARAAVLSDACPDCGHDVSWHGENHDDGCRYGNERCECGLNALECHAKLDKAVAVDELVAAARATGAADERDRECIWRTDVVEPWIMRKACGAWTRTDDGVPVGRGRYCEHCGGKVRVEDPTATTPP